MDPISMKCEALIGNIKQKRTTSKDTFHIIFQTIIGDIRYL